MLHQLKQLFWQQRKFIILFISLLVGIFFVIQLYLNVQLIKLTIAAGSARGESYQLAQIVVTQKSGIKQIADLKGKRIAIPPVEDRADDFSGFYYNIIV